MAISMTRTLPDLSKMEPLDCTNFKRWSQKLLIFFEQLEVDYVLFTDPPEITTQTTNTSTVIITTSQRDSSRMEDELKAKYGKDNRTVRGHLLNYMTNTLFDLFVNHKSARTIWNTLESRYGGDDAGRKKYIVGKWLQFQIVDGKSIMDQVHEYENIVADVLNEDMKMCEILQANVLLEKFPPSWNDYRNHLKHNKRDLTLQELISHMRTEEANRQISMQSQKFKKNVQQKSHKGNDGKIQKNKYQCYCCGKTGHKAYQCYQRKDQQKTNQKQNPQLNLAETKEIIAAVVVEANLVENKVDWILDTGASKHFCANKELFHEFHEASDGECVFMGNSTTAGVMGKGKVLLKLTSRKILALLDVLYVPSLRRNLISGSLLNKVGLKIVLESDKELDNQIASLNKFDSSSNSSMENVVEIRRSKRQKTECSFGPDFLTSFLTEDLNRIDEQFVSAFLVDEDPKTYVEAITSIDSSFWKEAIKNELDSIMTNHTWDLVDLPVGSKPIKCKWIFKKKIKPDGSIDKFKARLVVVGYTQKKGIDYFDTYSSVTKIATIRVLIALSAINDLMIHQMDVKTAFLNGDLEEEIYMEQPEGFVVPGLESKATYPCGVPLHQFLCTVSQAAIGIAKNYAYNGKRRHIRLRHSAIKELLKNGIISLDYVRSERNLADPLTKGLTRRIIQETSRAMGLKALGIVKYGDNYT
ncbi:Retrovirus-related Pol polyprotein from transposon TNT 1-94 [Sesamum angolense]|uniref:Retrovirus-related Pol polyprotein from transposon TNT 1-94 n=1 Tax=Sesamum angolense TaxID=2727404 RepID=A0AAE1VXT7_9LAMI|nr:Retrovirus-related Pol polyprotein from transposon TNT 1-94 [Sesamum angolense]